MANEIYSNTWWGDAYNTAGTLVQNPPLPNIEAYKLRVIGDGGIYEVNTCMANLASINPLLFDSQFIYVDRVVSDGGVIENTYCLALNINEIANL